MSMKLADILPAPSAVTDEWSRVRHDPWFRGREEQLETTSGGASKKASAGIIALKEPPPYGKRSGFVPRTAEDFGDGGAFPEIATAQYPLGMGMDSTRRSGATVSKTVALQYDSEGKLRHDAIARIGQGKDKIVYSRLADAKAQIIDEDDESFHRPDEELIQDTTEATRRALEKITATKVDAALPVRHAEKQAPAQYIRYTPSQQAGNFNSGAQQRIIRMVEAQKIPRAPPSPPAPVMHSPTRKVTVKEQADWKIPPCISNWKNPKGFTIALDKRLAADGRGLQQVHINENFAKLAESLYIADRKAREAVEMRAQMERRVAQNKKAEQEEKMRQMAQKARQERAGIARRGAPADEKTNEEEKERSAIRRDRLDDRRKERNIARNKPEKLERMRRDKERDISEKIALGLPDNRARDGETQFDQRLFNQSQGLDAGGIDDESFAVYDKAWRPQDKIQQHLYRPSKNIDKDIYGDDLDKIINTNKFVPDRGFSGTDGSGAPRGAGPVQFEREEDDPFGLGQLLEKARAGTKRGGDRGGEEESTSSSKRNRK